MRKEPIMGRLLIAGGLALTLLGPLQAQEKDKKDANKQIAELISKLGDVRFEVRQGAHRALVEIGKPALPQLRTAANGGDVEIARRAEQIIRQIEAPPKLQKSRVWPAVQPSEMKHRGVR
jgi:hypothetical protein